MKIAVTIATAALAVMASLYVLDVISSEALQEVFRKVMAVVAIFTGAGLVTLRLTSIGDDKPAPGQSASKEHKARLSPAAPATDYFVMNSAPCVCEKP